ncbi:MAG: hypothetical protein KHZ27_09675 [Fusobacterium sp.]|nr:hypothetical protein [Fusobacterium sp.]
MKKIIITCPSCHKKMKVLNKVAKYKCPSCGHIYKVNPFMLAGFKIKGFFTGIIETGKDIKNNIKYKINSIRATYNYMKQMKQNMKNNPNWSNYHREQREMKNANKRSFKDFFRKK